ncbi:MAG: FAD-binding protein [Kiritimatiellae bacterium]|nr:FAD-binding protein [Kiritimatiellia bacterium]
MTRLDTLIIGSGAAGLAAAVRLNALGVRVAIYTEGLHEGTSANAGSDKQTYYKLAMDGAEPDSPVEMARDLASGGAMHGDIALVEAALSPIAFAHLVSLGVRFPHDAYGRYVGYRTDHSEKRRATSAGPYTSRDMCAALAKEVLSRGVPVVENRVAVELLVRDGTAIGAIFADMSSMRTSSGGPGSVPAATPRAAATAGGPPSDAATPRGPSFETVIADNVIFAVGGPGGLYGRSVYPGGHTGAIGLALQAGAEARNLAESQFGLASIAFRWNVSGSYMQVIPRVYSLDADGVEREFLTDAFGSPAAAADAIFLKGYQWPFSAGNARGSSLVDILVYIETVLKGRRVFLDYRRNPTGLADVVKAVSAEARDYLENSDATGPTPFARLQAMNPKAIGLYRDHAIDIETEPLEVAVCAQHNNGGLAGDIWWESTNVRHLFPIGEVNGSHGVTRPGGSALNSGQVGAWRAAERIARGYANDAASGEDAEAFAHAAEAQLAEMLARPAVRDWRTDRLRMQERMDRAGGFIRRRDEVRAAIAEAEAELPNVLTDGLGGLNARECAEALRTRQLAFAHLVYLRAIEGQIDRAGSRGGAIVIDSAGEPIAPCLCEEWRMAPEKTAARDEVAICCADPSGKVIVRHEPCRPVPSEIGWFERVWAEYETLSPHTF